MKAKASARKLTPRESKIAAMAITMCNAQIAAALRIKEQSVKNCVSGIYRTLKISGRNGRKELAGALEAQAAAVTAS
jgi:DNA-binding NarL/FixJ family response regulator